MKPSLFLKNNSGFLSLIGILLAILIIGILFLFTFKIYFGRNYSEQEKKIFKEQGIDITNYQSVIDSSKKRVIDFNKEQEERLKELGNF